MRRVEDECVWLDLPPRFELPNYDHALALFKAIHFELGCFDGTVKIKFGGEKRGPDAKSQCKSIGKELKVVYHWRQAGDGPSGTVWFSDNVTCEQEKGEPVELEEEVLAPQSSARTYQFVLPEQLKYHKSFVQQLRSFLPQVVVLDDTVFEERHDELMGRPGYATLWALLTEGGVRLFRFLDERGSLSRLILFPIDKPWPLLLAEYLQSLPRSPYQTTVTAGAGQSLLDSDLLCSKLDHYRGIATLFVDVAKPTTAPVDVVAKPTTAPKHSPAQSEPSLVSYSAGPVTASDMDTLQGHNWLNDVVINSYMELLNLHHERRGILAFNSYFYTQLSTGYHRVARWTRQTDVFAFRRLIFPINTDNLHWSLAVINLPLQRCEYFDSLGGSNSQCLERLRGWLQRQSVVRARPLPLAEWENIEHECPSQTNGFDCGVFTLRFAERVALGKRLDFTQADMPQARKFIAEELLAMQLRDWDAD